MAFAINYIKNGEKQKAPISAVSFINNDRLRIYNIFSFPYKKILIDFNNPDLSINEFVSDTEAVEKQCPVGVKLGVIGIGEGVVLSTLDRKYVFKSKGEKHSVSKVKTVSKVDEIMITNINEFVDSVVTENRLKQGIEYFGEKGWEVEPKNTGNFIKWVQSDVKSEELDLILANKLDWKILNNTIANKSRKFYLENC